MPQVQKAAGAPQELLEADAIRRHPRFPEAALQGAAAMVEVYRGHRILNRLLNDRGRFVLSLLALDLHVNPRPGDRPPGLSLTRLQAVAAAHGVCSPGRTAAIIAVMRLFGLLKAAAAADRRVQVLVPSERLIALHRERLARLYAAMAPVVPEAAEAAARLEEPGFLAAVIGSLGARFRAGHRLVAEVPQLRGVLERDAGLMILASLAVASAPAGERLRSGEPAPAPLSITALAKRFGVSRGHVLTVLREAERGGLVARSASGSDRILVEPALIEVLEAFFAAVFRLQESCIREALASRP
jgi:DNA-binding MarR family transcriptional regulator